MESKLYGECFATFMGQNIPGKKSAILLYAGNAATYRKECQDVAAKGYEGFVLQ